MTTSLQRTSLGELGGYNPLLASSLGELGVGTVTVPPAEPQYPPKAGPVSAPGGGFAPYRSPHGPRRDEPFIDEWEDDEEELIIALCAAFLEMIE